MKVWLVRDLEPLPGDPGGRRLMRAGMLAQTLAGSGHETTWFTSTFDHQLRRQRAAADAELAAGANLTVRMFRAPGYRSTIGLARLRHNAAFGRAFAAHAAASSERPDIVVADIPTTEAARAAVAFARARDIPAIVQVRDRWPDFFADFVPPVLRPAVWLASRPLDAQVRFACRHAASIVGVSPAYLAWGQAKGGRVSPLDRVFPLGYRPAPENAAAAAAALARMGVAPADRVVAFVGSWGASYDLDRVFRAASLLAARPDVVFVVAGDSAAQPAVAEKLAALPNVRLAGWLGRDEIAALLRRAEIGLLPYVAGAPQGLPNKAFEYMAYGAYQVSTLGGELAGFYAETGAGAAVLDPAPQALADAIARALDDPAVAAARPRRLAAFAASFDADAIYGALVRHIEAVAAGGVSPPPQPL